MVDRSLTLTLVQVTLFGLNVLCALIYCLIILCGRRLRHVNNMFKFNVSLASIGCNLYFGIFFAMQHFDIEHLLVNKYCLFLVYMYVVAPLQIPLAFVSFSIHRICLIIYHARGFFIQRQWAILCIGTQWIVGFLIPIPYLIRNEVYSCFFELWMHIYAAVMVVLVPTLICFIINVRIFIYVRSLSKRIQPSSISISVVGNTSEYQRPRAHSTISRRDMSLIWQMVFLLTTFLFGWGPVYFILILNDFIFVCPLVPSIFAILAGTSSLINIFHLFFYDHEMQDFLREQFRRYIGI